VGVTGDVDDLYKVAAMIADLLVRFATGHASP
jgi:hypothetical protein